MNPALIEFIIQAATTIAGPAFALAMTEFGVVGADMSKHASAIQTFQDAVAALTAALAPPVAHAAA
ncbi:MAG: hypothetical protein IVW54_22300 [Candidatus Binataceae bacterium]|nr:hypothetical protein [Candidatus Binataceae bacterium]